MGKYKTNSKSPMTPDRRTRENNGNNFKIKKSITFGTPEQIEDICAVDFNSNNDKCLAKLKGKTQAEWVTLNQIGIEADEAIQLYMEFKKSGREIAMKKSSVSSTRDENVLAKLQKNKPKRIEIQKMNIDNKNNAHSVIENEMAKNMAPSVQEKRTVLATVTSNSVLLENAIDEPQQSDIGLESLQYSQREIMDLQTVPTILFDIAPETPDKPEINRMVLTKSRRRYMKEINTSPEIQTDSETQAENLTLPIVAAATEIEFDAIFETEPENPDKPEMNRMILSKSRRRYMKKINTSPEIQTVSETEPENITEPIVEAVTETESDSMVETEPETPDKPKINRIFLTKSRRIHMKKINTSPEIQNVSETQAENITLPIVAAATEIEFDAIFETEPETSDKPEINKKILTKSRRRHMKKINASPEIQNVSETQAENITLPIVAAATEIESDSIFETESETPDKPKINRMVLTKPSRRYMKKINTSPEIQTVSETEVENITEPIVKVATEIEPDAMVETEAAITFLNTVETTTKQDAENIDKILPENKALIVTKKNLENIADTESDSDSGSSVMTAIRATTAQFTIDAHNGSETEVKAVVTPKPPDTSANNVVDVNAESEIENDSEMGSTSGSDYDSGEEGFINREWTLVPIKMEEHSDRELGNSKRQGSPLISQKIKRIRLNMSKERKRAKKALDRTRTHLPRAAKTPTSEKNTPKERKENKRETLNVSSRKSFKVSMPRQSRKMIYIINKIVDHRRRADNDNKFEYKVKWEGYNSDYDSWEPASNFYSSEVMLHDYYVERYKKPCVNCGHNGEE